MPLQATSGAASYDAFGGGVAAVPNYIEDVFSTYLYTGTGASQTQTNNIDLAGKGGLVWLKKRSAAESNYLQDSSSSFANSLVSNTTAAALVGSGIITSVSSTGFTTSSVSSGTTYASWTFRKQPKFFDVVTFTSDGTNTQQISHSLASVPGCIILKRTNSTGNWIVWHRGDGTTDRYTFSLNNTSAANSSGSTFVATGKISSTIFSPNYLEDYLGNRPVSGGTYVAYVFAHDAGGFGLTGTDNVISCGSFTTDGSGNATVNLGYEPQWVMYKSSSTAGGAWQIFDSMRGLTMGADNTLSANATTAEGTGTDWLTPSATGFSTVGAVFYTSATYIYIAIRRGPMKVPTSGTSVFLPTASSAAQGTVITTGWPVDQQLIAVRAGNALNFRAISRLQGVSTTDTAGNTAYLSTASTSAESANSTAGRDWNNTGYDIPDVFNTTSCIYYAFQRAPSFMDVVCYTGTGSAGRTVAHNLTVTPEMMIVKRRNGADSWVVYAASQGATKYFELQLPDAVATGALAWNNTAPTSSVFSTGTYTNQNTDTYVAYLFATCAGVSKVGSYTGTGTTKQVDCGFSAGSRFVMIKRTDSTGDWYVWDSARGIVAGNDPYLLMNSSSAEVTSTDYIDTYSAGFEISSTAPAAINASGGTFIFLAIA